MGNILKGSYSEENLSVERDWEIFPFMKKSWFQGNTCLWTLLIVPDFNSPKDRAENKSREYTYKVLRKCWNSAAVSNIAILPMQSQASLPVNHVQSNLMYSYVWSCEATKPKSGNGKFRVSLLNRNIEIVLSDGLESLFWNSSYRLYYNLLFHVCLLLENSYASNYRCHKKVYLNKAEWSK